MKKRKIFELLFDNSAVIFWGDNVKKGTVSMIIYLIISYVLTIIIPASKFVQEKKQTFILTADKILLYIVLVVLVLSLIEGFIINRLDKKEIRVALFLSLIIVILLVAALIVDFNKWIVIFIKYRYMIFSIVSLFGLLLTTCVKKQIK